MTDTKTVNDPEYDERVRHRVLILQKYMKEGKILFARNPDIEKSLLACKFDSNGEVDLSTVDSVVRSIALAAEHMEYREECKNAISLKEIQNSYFTFIANNFSFFYEIMQKSQATPHQIASAAAYGNSDFHELVDNLNAFIEAVVGFWENYSASAYVHMEDSNNTLKGIFGGDFFPYENIASKCGIYLDTIILPCPFIRSKYLFTRWEDKEKIYYLVKHALNILSYRELALADTDYPIVAILPDKEMLHEIDENYVKSLSEQDGLFHSGKLFGRNFTSIDELMDFAEQFDTVEKVMANVKDRKRILFNVENEASIEEQFVNQINGESGHLLGMNHPGLVVASLAFGRMNVCNELLIKAMKLKGTPVIDAPTSWEYFKWKMEYDAERTYPNRDFQDLHIIKGLHQLRETPLQWVGKIPPEALIELRKTGAINEIRSVLANGIEELVSADTMNFGATSQRVFNNLNKALIQHEENIKKLKNKKWKIAGTDFGSWLVMGSIEIASACIGTPLYGVSTVVLNQLLDAPKLRDLPESVKRIKTLNEDVSLLKRSPLGLMFSYKS